MTTKSATIAYQLNYRRYLMPVAHASDLAALHTFAAKMKTVTNADTVKTAFIETERLALVAGPSNDLTSSIDYYCDVILRCGTKRRGVPYPAPKFADFESVTERNQIRYRLKQAVGKQIAQWYSTLSGETYTFVSGYLCGPASQKTG